MSKLWTVVGFQKVISNVLKWNKTISLLKMPFYAVANGRTPGIFMSWADCEAQVKGFSGARYKKFDSAQQAQDFITTIGNNIGVTKSKTNNYKPQSFPSSSSYNNYKPQGFQSSSSYSNLKRPYSDNSSHFSGYQYQSKPKYVSPKSDSESDAFSDDSEDLNTILTKQLDDVEKRVKGFGKNFEKIISNSAKNYSGRKTVLIEPPKPKKRRSGNVEYNEDTDGFVNVYTDGACSGNGRNGARAGIGVYWGDGHPLNVSEPVSGRATNNCGEIQAATKAIKQALQNGVTKISINTDSKFLIDSVTKWLPGWKQKGWKLRSGEPVKNEIDFKDLDSVANKVQIKWNYVEAHKGVHGNEMADQLAKAGAAMYGQK